MSDNYLLYDPADFGALEIKEDTRDAEILRLRAENEKLRAALKPFAECNPIERDDTWFAHAIRIEDFHAAYDVYKVARND